MRVLVVGADPEIAETRALFERWPSARIEGAPASAIPPADEDGSIALVRAGSPTDPALDRVAPLSAARWTVVVAAEIESPATRTRALAAGAVDVLYGPLSAERIAEAAALDQGRRLRKELRFVTSIPWSLERSSGVRVQGTVIDLSAGGFKFHSEEILPRGEIVRVHLEAPESHAIPVLHARVLSSAVIEKGAWVRGRFVGMLRREREPLVNYLRSLAREDLDAAAAMAALRAMTTASLMEDGGSVGGLPIPKLIPLEKSWIAAKNPLASVTLARCRANMIATLLSVKPPPGEPPFTSLREEIGRARDLLRAQTAHDAPLREVVARLEAASRFLEGIADHAEERLASGDTLPDLPAVAAPAAPVRSGPGAPAPISARRVRLEMLALYAVLAASAVAVTLYFVHALAPR